MSKSDILRLTPGEDDDYREAYAYWENKAKEAQAEVERLRPLAENWELVEAMPVGTELAHVLKNRWDVIEFAHAVRVIAVGGNPEAALLAVRCGDKKEDGDV